MLLDTIRDSVHQITIQLHRRLHYKWEIICVCVKRCLRTAMCVQCTCGSGSACVCIALYYYYARTQRFGQTWILTVWKVAPFKCHSMWPNYGELRTVYNTTGNNNNIHCIVYHILCMWTGVVLFGNSQHNKRSAQCANLSIANVCLKTSRFFCLFERRNTMNFWIGFWNDFWSDFSILPYKNVPIFIFFKFFLNFFKFFLYFS